MRVRPLRLAITMSAALGLAAWGGYHINKRGNQPTDQAQVVRQLSQNQLLLGFFANHVTDGRHISCLEQRLDQNVDLSVRYMTVQEPFPIEEANVMSDRGGALYIKVKLRPADLDALLRGRLNDHLNRLNSGLNDFGGRIILGFDLEEVSAAANLDQVAAHIHQELSASNITWVWNRAFGPAPANVQWTSIDLFQRSSNGSWPTFERLLETELEANQTAGLPIMLSVGSSAPAEVQAEFIDAAIRAALENERIGGLVIYNTSDRINWQLNTEALTRLNTRIRDNRSAFATGVDGNAGPAAAQALPSWQVIDRDFTRVDSVDRAIILAEDALGVSGELDPSTFRSQECNIVLNEFYSRNDLQRNIDIRRTIRQLNNQLEAYRGSTQEAPIRQNLAQQYTELANYSSDTGRRVSLLRQALEVLEEPVRHDQARRQRGELPNRFPTVPGYFDLRIQIAAKVAEIGAGSSLLEAETECQTILTMLESDRAVLEQQVASYTVAGNLSRVNLVLGRINERLGRPAAAREYFVQADEWATGEQARTWPVLFWRGESRTKLRHTAALGRLGQARTYLIEGDTNAVAQVPEQLASLFLWEEVGRESNGFMDLGFEALIYSMWACLESSQSLEQAKIRFQESLPWQRINQYEDMVTALGHPNGLPIDNSGQDLWNAVLEGLRNAQLNPDQTGRLDQIVIISGVAARSTEPGSEQ